MPTDILISTETPIETTVIGKKVVILNDAQIKALPTTPIEIVAAPGANKVLVALMCVCDQNASAGGYTNADAEAATGLTYDSTNDLTTASSNLNYGVVFTSAARSLCFLTAPTYELSGVLTGFHSGQSMAASWAINKGLYFCADNMGDGDFTGGNAANTMKVVVYYTIVDLA